jgi:hypothetical protein
MAAKRYYHYHDQEAYGRAEFAALVGISEPQLKKIIRGRPEDDWADVIDSYLREQNRGPLASSPPDRAEIEACLGSYAKNDYMTILSAKPLYLDLVRTQTAGMRSDSNAEMVYCWIHKTEPPACDCGNRRTFNSMNQGYYPTCGAKCTLGRGRANPATWRAAAETIAADLGIVNAQMSDDEIEQAIRLAISSKPKNYVDIVRAVDSLRSWVEHRSSGIPRDAEWPERIHVALTSDSPWCPRGQRRAFSRISDGYMFCGHQSDCVCSLESTAANVRAAKKADAPLGHITSYEWASRHGLNPATVNNEIRTKHIPGVRIGRGLFVPADHPPPREDEKVRCNICDARLLSISVQHLAKHDVTPAEYVERYGGRLISARSLERLKISMARYIADLPEEVRLTRFSKSRPAEFFAEHLESLGLVQGPDFLRECQLVPDVPLPFDFVLPDKMICVEVDGPHHWERWVYACRGGRTPEQMFATQQRADKARNTMARNLGYRMFRLRVRATLDDVEPFRSQLRSQGFPDDLLA